MKSDPLEHLSRLSGFSGQDLTQTLRSIETSIPGITRNDCLPFLSQLGADQNTFRAAVEMKRLAAQIDVTVHALGILLCLPSILEPAERVQYVSLGAGNTGRDFDLETNFRVAEFKFIRWRGGAESIRQNQVFKDFFELAQSDTTKRKYLYLQGTYHALKFLQGGRSIDSILSRNHKVRTRFFTLHGKRFRKVREYFAAYHKDVNIVDISHWFSAPPEPDPRTK